MSQSSLRLVESSSMDKDKSKALDAALSQIERAFGKGSIMKLGTTQSLDIAAISTGSLGLDIALGIGGLPKGRVIEIYGPESSGKTTLALGWAFGQADRRWRFCLSGLRLVVSSFRDGVPDFASIPSLFQGSSQVL